MPFLTLYARRGDWEHRNVACNNPQFSLYLQITGNSSLYKPRLDFVLIPGLPANSGLYNQCCVFGWKGKLHLGTNYKWKHNFLSCHTFSLCVNERNMGRGMNTQSRELHLLMFIIFYCSFLSHLNWPFIQFHSINTNSMQWLWHCHHKTENTSATTTFHIYFFLPNFSKNNLIGSI